jgi:hypothetical protein
MSPFQTNGTPRQYQHVKNQIPVVTLVKEVMLVTLGTCIKL